MFCCRQPLSWAALSISALLFLMAIALPGYGGNYIVLLHDLNMVIVTTADPLHDKWNDDPWQYEGAINKLVGNFVKSLPNE